MRLKFFSIFSLFFLGGFLILPKTVLAELQLSKQETNLLLNAIQEVLVDNWIDLTASPEFSQPEKQAALFIIRNAIQKQELDYFFKEIPKETLKSAIKLAGFLLTHQEAKAILEKLEKESVKKAIEIGMDWLLQKEIKIAKGHFDYSFTSYLGNSQKPSLHYLIAYQGLGNQYGKVAIEFYSPEEIEPQKASASTLWVGRTSWDFSAWRAAGNTKLSPFIIRLKGKVEKLSLGGYLWQETELIVVTFSEQVPEFKEETKIPNIPFVSDWLQEWQERFEKIKILTKKLAGILQPLKERAQDFGTNLKKQVKSNLEELKSTLWHFFRLGGAEIAQIGGEETISEAQREIEEELKSLKETLPESEKPESSPESQFTEPKAQPRSLEEIQEDLDEIAERIDILSQTMNELVGEEKAEKGEEIQEELGQEKMAEREKEGSPELAEGKKETKPKETTALICQKRPNDWPRQNRVIINEVGWMGTTHSANDEWIELKNISGQEINLSGWQLLDKENQIKIIFSNQHRVLINGFFLLERTDDNTLPGIPADLIFTGTINNFDEALYLFNENCQLEDEVLALPEWPAGDNKNKKSMERGSNLSWHTFSGLAFYGIEGSPKRENSSGIIYASGGRGTGSGKGSQEEKTEGKNEKESNQKSPSFCSQENLGQASHTPVIINEVAWMGTLEDSNNEWFELKNLTDENVSLNGWQILDKAGQIKIIFGRENLIPANGFFLLERTDDNTLPGIEADFIYAGALSNNNESLRLFDQNCKLIDEVLANPDWPAGDNQTKRTMERKSDLSWQNFLGQAANGIMGTPKAENSQLTQGAEKENKESEEQEDTTPPTVILDISLIGETIFLSWQADDGQGKGVLDYDLKYKEGGSYWQDLLTRTQLTEFSFLGQKGKTYYFLIRARDKAGNESSWIENFVEIPLLKPNVLISEVQIAEEEFVEIYNLSQETIELCPGQENCWYFAYFSSERDWNNPWRIKQFPQGAKILAKSYYLIGLEGYPESDWQAYQSPQLGNNSGAVAIFSCNPKDSQENPKTPEEAKACKIDALGWGEALVKEGQAANPAPTGKSLARKLAPDSQGYLVYLDSNNNLNDFEIQELTPKALNQHSYSDLDKDGIIDSYDPETILRESIEILAGEYNFQDLILEPAGELILKSRTDLEGAFKGVKILANNLRLKEGSKIKADGQGYPAGQGPGAGQSHRNPTGGGSYGGQGGFNPKESIYGSFLQPIDFGSGGGIWGATGASGGGAIWLEIRENLTLDGLISANGQTSSEPGSSGGSGGSVYIRTNKLTGSGKIQALGGDGKEASFVSVSGGGGGRIAIYYQNAEFDFANLQTYGGLGFGGKPGGPGTIYLKKESQTYGDLIIKNNNLEGSTFLLGELNFNNFQINQASQVFLPENGILNAKTISISQNSSLEFQGAGEISGQNLKLENQSSLIGPDRVFLNLNLTESLNLESQSKIEANVLIDVPNISISKDSKISADGKGYPFKEGPGAGRSYQNPTGGGSYGGQGGFNTKESIYGNPEEPIDFGSGGGIWGAWGAWGGGAIRLNISQELIIDGLISANGQTSSEPGSSGGSGGSVYIRTNKLRGSGQIMALGGDGKEASFVSVSGGGGGRIAIYYQNSTFPQGNIQASGGKGSLPEGGSDGQPGTIIYQLSP